MDSRIEDETDYSGADIDSIYGVESTLQCQSACEEHPRCFAFTFVKSEQACWLKGEGYATKSNPRTISGRINASLATQRRADLDSGENELSTSVLEDDNTYDDFEHRQRHEYEEGDEDQLLGDDGDDGMMPLEVSDDDITKFNDSTSFFGDVQLLFDVHEVSDCQAECVANGRCVAWSLHKFR